MARSTKPAVRLRSKTKKTTNFRSSARYSREDLNELRDDRRSGEGRRDDRSASRGDDRGASRSTGRSTSRTEGRGTSRTEGRGTSRTEGRGTSRTEGRSASRGEGYASSRSASGSSRTRRVDAVEQSSGVNATERRRTRQTALSHMDTTHESPERGLGKLGASRRTRSGDDGGRGASYGEGKTRRTGTSSRDTSRTAKGDRRSSADDRAEGRSGSDRRSGDERGAARSQRTTKPGAEVQQGESLRLNKFLADAGIASRRGADELIDAGVVKVNGKVITEQGTKVHPGDLVTVKGEPVSYMKHLTYLVLNKPKDYITTTNDEKGRKTVMDLIPLRQRLYPVGRLDRNTTGTLIVTNDGELATRLMHPSHEIEREYVVGLDKRLMPEHARLIVQGVQLEDGMTGPCELFINPDDRSEVRIILKEGRNREVRRIFEHFHYEVKRLHRMRYANISVSGLSRAEYRHLTRDEVHQLRRLVGLD